MELAMKRTPIRTAGVCAVFGAALGAIFLAGAAEARQRKIPATPQVRAQIACQQEVARRVPRIHEPGAERRRSHLYRLCMHRKGFRP